MIHGTAGFLLLILIYFLVILRPYSRGPFFPIGCRFFSRLTCPQPSQDAFSQRWIRYCVACALFCNHMVYALVCMYDRFATHRVLWRLECAVLLSKSAVNKNQSTHSKSMKLTFQINEKMWNTTHFNRYRYRIS